MKLEPTYSTEWDLLDEGLYLFQVSELTSPSGDSNLLKIRVIAQDEPWKGSSLIDNFPLSDKGNYFGYKRLYGLMVKLGVMKEGGIDHSFFDNSANLLMLKQKAEKKFFGGLVKHNVTSQGKTVANIVRYMTPGELKLERRGSILERSSGEKGNVGNVTSEEIPTPSEPSNLEGWA